MPTLDKISPGTWQHGSTTISFISAGAGMGFKSWPTTIHFGHDTAARMAKLLLLQVLTRLRLLPSWIGVVILLQLQHQERLCID